MEKKYSRKRPLPRKEAKALLKQGLKRCFKCEQTLDLSLFSKNKGSCRACSKLMTDGWLERNPDYHKEQRLKTREKRTAYNKKWREDNQERYLEAKHKNRAKRRETDPMYRIANSLRCRLYSTVIKGYKSQSTFELLGCSLDELKSHLEALFTEGMNWDNYGHDGWHIDHRVPCAAFNLLDPEEQKKCFHYSNLQPLWAEDNMRKGSKIIAKHLDNDK